MNSAVANITTVPLTEARYAILLWGEIKECFGSFEEAAYAYNRWLDQFQPHAQNSVTLIKVERVVEPGEEIGFY
jgi:hypothetical protein